MSTNYAHGKEAEKVAAKYLSSLGYDVIEQNWKTRWCEIDVVACKDNVIYFVEVKYRRNTDQGGGLDYITPKKLQQMHFAAEMWVSDKRWQGEYQLAALEVSGGDYIVTNFLTEL